PQATTSIPARRKSTGLPPLIWSAGHPFCFAVKSASHSRYALRRSGPRAADTPTSVAVAMLASIKTPSSTTAPGWFGTCVALSPRINTDTGVFPSFPTNRKPQPTNTVPLARPIVSLGAGAADGVAPARIESGGDAAVLAWLQPVSAAAQMTAEVTL